MRLHDVLSASIQVAFLNMVIVCCAWCCGNMCERASTVLPCAVYIENRSVTYDKTYIQSDWLRQHDVAVASLLVYHDLNLLYWIHRRWERSTFVCGRALITTIASMYIVRLVVVVVDREASGACIRVRCSRVRNWDNTKQHDTAVANMVVFGLMCM